MKNRPLSARRKLLVLLAEPVLWGAYFRPWAFGLCLLGCVSAGCATVTQSRPPAITAHNIIQAAKAMQGKPYRYGGQTPEGFDCSGLVQYVYGKTAGIRLPRTSRAQFAFARPVRLGNEEPSDLLFFDISGRGISHVGIYLGKGYFVHAPQSGGKVKISNANKPYWRRRFRGIRRIL